MRALVVAVLWLGLAIPLSSAASPLCGDLDQTSTLGGPDLSRLRDRLAGLDPLDPVESLLCDLFDEVYGPGAEPDPADAAGRCTVADATVLARSLAGRGPSPASPCPLASTEPCASPHAGVGCDEPPVALCVCAQSVACCTLDWAPSCASLAESPACSGVKIVATGDTGEGNPDQYAVGLAMDARCAAAGGWGCTAAILTGDNFYDDGVDSVDDPQWDSKFELPYGLPALAIPFYPVLGNHDYGPTSTGNPFAQIGYSFLPIGPGAGQRASDRWTLPEPYYDVVLGDDLVHLFLLDTQSVFPHPSISAQLDDMQTRVAASTAVWKIAVGHHPRFTSGEHQLDNVLLNELTELLNPPGMFALQQDVYCGTDLYLSGHDHDREFIDRGQDPDCPDTYFAISGAGSKLGGEGRVPVSHQLFFDDQVEGFAYLSLSANALQFEFYDKDGALAFSRLIAR